MLRGPIREAIDTGQPLAASALERVSTQFGHRDDYADTLIVLAADATDNVSAAATWLIKHHLEQGKTLSPAQTGKLIETLVAVTAWGAQLHVCQSIRFLDIPPNYATTLIAWLRPLRSHSCAPGRSMRPARWRARGRMPCPKRARRLRLR